MNSLLNIYSVFEKLLKNCVRCVFENADAIGMCQIPMRTILTYKICRKKLW